MTYSTRFAIRLRWPLLAAAIALAACGEIMREDSVINFDPVTQSEWQTLAGKRIIFGHQSVGENILSGVRSLSAQHDQKLVLAELANAASGAGFLHLTVGKNENPFSKINDFEKAMQSDAGKAVDVALMKLCYLDIRGDTDIKSLADAYFSSIDRLSRKFPRTIFVAVTAPVTTVQTGVKAWVKVMIGRTPAGYIENARRQDFNKLVREQYLYSGNLFDLAKIESEGGAEVKHEGILIETLNSAISSDGGHLNSQGQQFVASKLVKFIAKLPSRN